MANSRKIHTRDGMLQWRNQMRIDGKTVVHCHGCFDIVHPGHIHHLQYARSLGDVLIVTVSADSQVNKGINRPLIPDELRAASLAALECVDAVYVNDSPTAVELLGALQPDIYVKGQEYARNNDPRFLAERDTVLQHGGRVIFSSGDIVYSSTALINGLESRDLFHDEKVQRLRQRYDLSSNSLHALVQRFRGKRVLVIGDFILDKYHFCDATGIAGEGPMMSLRLLKEQEFDGGAGVIARHLAAMDASPVLMTSLAGDEISSQIQMRLESQGVTVRAIHHRKQVVSKRRYLVDHNKLMKVDEGGMSPLDLTNEKLFAEQILEESKGADGVIFADFGYGTITSGLLDRVMSSLRSIVPVITADVSGKQANLMRFKEVDLLCPTEREVRDTMQDFSSGLGAVVWNLLAATGARQAMITLGKQGLVTFDCPGTMSERLRSEYVPALATHAIDPLGCGDALLAIASLALCAGGSLQAAALLGSIAAALEAQQLGNHAITSEQLLSKIHEQTSHLESRLAS